MTTRTTTRGLLAASAALTLALTGCTASGGGATAPTPSSDSASLASSLDLALAELVAMPGGPPGAISLVQVGDDLTVHTAGVAEVGSSTPPAPDDFMRIASVAKAFSGATALALVDEGTLSLDDTIGELLPDLPQAWADVTLRQLLDHTSGLPDFTKSPSLAEAAGASLDVAPAPDQLLTFAADEPLNFPPGSEYRYSNSDNIAVGLMIQAATGKPYTDSLQSLVLDPLKLDSTSLPVGTEMPEPTFHGYDLDPPDAPVDVTTLIAAGWAWASGGVVSTPSDLNTFIRGYVGGELFGADTQALQTDLFIPGGESGPPGPGVNSASLSLFRYQTPCGTVYGHTGNTPGYTQFAVASPDGTRSATMSINLARNLDSTGQDLEVLHALQKAEAAAVCLALAS
ncbi:serine hydrolase domain-containing protein [Herbiconiux ginsengi]|uniref:D-alanyl-D-alanine carboxypeptidase n=1 Tax=Herbiconiux ginsengi TaxID=381665 RepID=A0A1H3RE86_9MICO|nr:serine hydrolase domain-containing protein [Herbiconiux ginsengi]SDZ24132.1 D-alanyl-D-alanine carboxypeptidase [Herbiconiux ginsengi]